MERPLQAMTLPDGNLRDGDVPRGEGFAKGAVLEYAVHRGDKGQDGDAFVRLSFTELN